MILLFHVILFVIHGPKAARRTWVREAPITARVRQSRWGRVRKQKAWETFEGGRQWPALLTGVGTRSKRGAGVATLGDRGTGGPLQGSG